MLERIIDLSLTHRAAVLAVTLVLVIGGVASFARLPFDAFPDTTPVQVQVNTNAPALAPLEVERQITFPLEQAVSGLPGLVEVRSVSKFGFSQITAIFGDEIDIYLARQVLAERLHSVGLPPGVEPPSLGPVSTGLGEVFQYLVESDELSAMELRTLHHWVIRPQMLQVPGVAEINTWGGFEKQFHVIIDPDRLLKYDLTLDDVADALQRNNANAGGGYVLQGGEAMLVQGIGLATSIDEIEQIIVAAHDGVPIFLRDVAEVAIGHEIRRGAVTADGRGEAVLGLGFMLMGENSRAVTKRLEARLDEVRASLPDNVRLVPVYSRTDLVDRVLVTVRNNLLEGALLVIAVLFVFLGNLRAGLIVAAAIPLSMLFAFSGMLRFGIAGSLMSLGAIDFGLVVDSSVIMVENASHRLAEDETGRSVREVVRDAAAEVRRPTLFGELIIAIVYLPILALEGIEGKLFRPMALTVLFALAASMVLSVTLMPVLATLVLKKGQRNQETAVVTWLKRRYTRALDVVLRRKEAVLAVVLLLLGNALFLASQIGTEFVPRLGEMAVVVNTVRLAGVSLEESARYGTQIERRLLTEFPDEIAHTWTRTGSAEVATDPMGLEVSDVFITLTPRAQWTKAKTQDALVLRMNEALEGLPGMRTIFTQPIEMRTNEMIAGIRADVGIKLYGDDFDILRGKAAQIRRRVEATPGAADVTVEQLTGLPVLQIEVDRLAVARYGVAAEHVLEVVEALGTQKVGEVVDGQRRFDLAVRLDERYRTDPAAVGRILVTTTKGERLPLSQLAKIRVVEGPATINREWAKRRVVVQANVRERDVGSFVEELRETIRRDVQMPPGYFVRYGGQFEHLERARTRLAIVVPIALVLVFVLLYFTYGRISDTLRVFTGVPFAAVGGVAALWLRDLPFSISAAVGFVALSGVAVLGDMVLASRIRQLVDGGMALGDAVRAAAASRLRPVLMTSLVAALGFAPMALNTGVGAEVQRPLATVVIGGMLTATLGTLFVMPILYALMRGSE
ncbi:MAG: CusA/CzcA family heavy metal efflux RND transporter [Deltaproteobacteria bacterium]